MLKTKLQTTIETKFRNQKFAKALRGLLESDFRMEAINTMLTEDNGKNLFFLPTIERQIKEQRFLFLKVTDWVRRSHPTSCVSMKEFLSLVKKYGLDGKKTLTGVDPKFFGICNKYVNEINKVFKEKGKYDTIKLFYDVNEKLREEEKKIGKKPDLEPEYSRTHFALYLISLQESLFDFILKKSGLMESHGFKLVAEHEIARDLILHLRLENRFNKLIRKQAEEKKKAILKKSYSKPAYWKTQMDYFLFDSRVTGVYLTAYAKGDLSEENIDALIVVHKWMRKSKVTKSQIEKFRKRFMDDTDTFDEDGPAPINLTGECTKKIKNYLKKAIDNKNLWQDEDLREIIFLLHGNIAINITDTYSRAKGFSYFQEVVNRRSKPKRSTSFNYNKDLALHKEIMKMRDFLVKNL